MYLTPDGPVLYVKASQLGNHLAAARASGITLHCWDPDGKILAIKDVVLQQIGSLRVDGAVVMPQSFRSTTVRGRRTGRGGLRKSFTVPPDEPIPVVLVRPA